MFCKNNDGISSVEHYYLNGYLPGYINATVPKLGISNARISVDQGYIICQFSRRNNFENSRYYDTNNNEAYILAAFGEMVGGNYFKPSNLLLIT